MQVLIINTVYSLSVIFHLLLIVCANVVTKWSYQNVKFKISIMLFYLEHRAILLCSGVRNMVVGRK